MTNTALLKEIIKSKGLKYKYIANKMGITYMSLNKKINNITEFTVPEVDRICEILGISNADEIREIFFKRQGD